MIYLGLGALVLVLLVWAGRRLGPVSNKARIASALLAALAAVAAVVAGLRGGWLAGLVLVALSAWLGETARRGIGRAAPGATAMGDAEARSILGVGADAQREEIEAAWRRLMQRAHPDHGGSDGLAAQLNAARDRLLR